MARRIQERDLLSVDRHYISADVLGNASGLPVCHMSVADRVQQRSFSMVYMAHNADYRRTGLQFALVLVGFLQQFLDNIHLFFRLGDDIVAEGNLLGLLKINLLVDCHHDALQEQFLYNHCRLHLHFFRQFPDGQLLRKGDLLDLLPFFLFLAMHRLLQGLGQGMLLAASLIGPVSAARAAVVGEFIFPQGILILSLSLSL